MKINEVVLTETWPLQLVKAFDMLRKAQKFKHLPDEKIKQMAHAVVKKWNDPATPAPKPKPHTVQDLTRQYKIDKKVMDDEEFKKFYGFSKYSKGKFVEEINNDSLITFDSFLEDAVNEHRMVWKSTKKGPKLAWRCTSGFRANRTVPDARDCGKPLDYAQRARMKVTRARTAKAQARKAKKTKKVSPTSKLIRKLNLATKPKKRKR